MNGISGLWSGCRPTLRDAPAPASAFQKFRPEVRSCACGCGETFTASQDTHRYASRRCASLDYEARQKEARGRPRKRRPDEERPCPVCAAPFLFNYSEPRRTCGAKTCLTKIRMNGYRTTRWNERRVET